MMLRRNTRRSKSLRSVFIPPLIKCQRVQQGLTGMLASWLMLAEENFSCLKKSEKRTGTPHFSQMLLKKKEFTIIL